MIERKTALMVVAGGRGVPDALALLYLKPKLVLPITSKEGWQTEKAFFDLARRIPGCKVLPMEHLDAYNLHTSMKACKELCEQYPPTEWDWICTLTSAPKILAFAAYEVAKDLKIPCWYSASQQEKLVSLVKEYPVDTKRFFHLTFEEYIKIQGRTFRENHTPEYRKIVASWGDIAKTMALSDDTYQLASIFYGHWKRPGKTPDDAVRDPMPFSTKIEALPLVKFLVDRGMLEVGKRQRNGTLYRFSFKAAAQFLSTGDWLEVYVWDQVNKMKAQNSDKPLADDCRWGCEIPKDKVKYELDVALMYRAQLVIAECKAVEQPFRGENNYLRNLDAVADQLGGDYVSKVFVTNQRGEGESYKIFCQQAAQRAIEVVTRERLSEIGQIMKEQAIHPKYPRI